MTIYIDIVMSNLETISMMSKSGYTDKELLDYIDEIEFELNGEVYKESKKHDRYLCMDCKLRKIVDYERSTLVCTKCGLCEYYPVYVVSYNLRCNLREGNAYTRDLIILRLY